MPSLAAETAGLNGAACAWHSTLLTIAGQHVECVDEQSVRITMHSVRGLGEWYLNFLRGSEAMSSIDDERPESEALSHFRLSTFKVKTINGTRAALVAYNTEVSNVSVRQFIPPSKQSDRQIELSLGRAAPANRGAAACCQICIGFKLLTLASAAPQHRPHTWPHRRQIVRNARFTVARIQAAERVDDRLSMAESAESKQQTTENVKDGPILVGPFTFYLYFLDSF